MKINKIISFLLIALLIVSCVDDLQETNLNPNEAQVAQPEYLLSNAIKSLWRRMPDVKAN